MACIQVCPSRRTGSVGLELAHEPRSEIEALFVRPRFQARYHEAADLLPSISQPDPCSTTPHYARQCRCQERPLRALDKKTPKTS